MNVGDFFEPADEAEKIDYAVEALALSVQLAIQKVMNEDNVTKKELAERLGVTPARMSQILSSKGANLTLRTLGKIAHALGEEFEFISHRDFYSLKDRAGVGQKAQFCEIRPILQKGKWVDATANSNKFPDLLAA